MAYTKSGVLYITKAEARGIQSVIQHTRVNISWGEGGSFNKESKDGDFPFDPQEAKRAERGLEVLEFVLQTAVIK